jgi:hypothetical protein
MDEECLMDYKAGGMEFDSITKFDEWISKPVNRDRILPFPKTMVAMRVRRFVKERDSVNSMLEAFIRIDIEKSDKYTFLYFRNGENVYRLCSEFDFPEMIFPDRADFDPTEEKMMLVNFNRIEKVVSKSEYDVLVENNDKYNKWAEENQGKDSWHNPHKNSHDTFRWGDWEPFNPDSLHYDDMCKEISDKMKEHNRIALIVQGLFDRSTVFHPHSPVRLYTVEGFNEAVTLIYDGDSSVLYPGTKLDFEGYRAACNAKITGESFLTGQNLFWMKKEAEKENERRYKDYRYRDYRTVTLYKPYGNNGPAEVCQPAIWKPKSKVATFKWDRVRLHGRYDEYGRWGSEGTVPCSISVPVSDLFNISAYKRGDYKKFFADPRTREEYLKWAPMLLTAEDFHAKDSPK